MDMPWIGYYHYEGERIFQEFNDYRKWYEKRFDTISDQSSDKVGIFFPRNLLIKKDIHLIHLLIQELEKRKIFPVPVFAQKKDYGGQGCPDAEVGIELLKGVDLVINCESSFLLQTPIREETGFCPIRRRHCWSGMKNWLCMLWQSIPAAAILSKKSLCWQPIITKKSPLPKSGLRSDTVPRQRLMNMIRPPYAPNCRPAAAVNLLWDRRFTARTGMIWIFQ